MPRWIMTEEPTHHTRAAAVGTAILLLLGILMGMVVGIGLTRLVEAAHLDEVAREFRNPAAAATADVGSLPA